MRRPNLYIPPSQVDYMGGSSYNPHEVDDDTLLRVSKSSFIGYAKCPRRYWWDKIALPDVMSPSSPEAERGRAIHAVMEDGLHDKKWDQHAEVHGVAGDIGVSALGDILAAVAEAWGGLEITEIEVKHEVPYSCEYSRQEEGVICVDHYDVILVGLIDAVFRMPDGSICIVELKTGSANQGKLSRTRKELAYYRYLYEQVHGEAATHFLTIFPDATDPKFLTDLMNKRNTEVFMGMTQGLGVLEPVGTRTVNAMFKTLHSSIHGIMTHEWPIKWSEYFCTQWCDYHLSCNEQLLGVAGDITMG